MQRIFPACSAQSFPRRASRGNLPSPTDDDFGAHNASRRVNPPADTDPPVTPATRLPFFLYFDLHHPPGCGG